MSESYKDIENEKHFSESLWFTTTIVCAVLSIYIYRQLTKVDSRIKRFLAKFPGPKTYPIFGSASEFLVPNYELLGVLKSMYEVHGSTFCVWLCNQPKLIIGDPIGIEKLLSSVKHINKGPDYCVLRPWLRTGLLTSSGDKWHNRRKLLTPTFHFKILEDFLEIFNEQSLVFVNILSTKYADTTKEFNLSPFISRYALDVICETAMGKKINAQIEDDSEYVRCVYSYTEILVHRFLQPWLRPQFIWKLTSLGRRETKYLKILHAFTEKVIEERKNDRKLLESQKLQCDSSVNQQEDEFYGKKKRNAFLDLLLDAAETSESLSDLDIREEVDTFMFEGHDTTSASLGWTLFLLGKHPEIQRKVQMELDDIFGEQKNPVVNMIDASRMKYLECCIKESLRLYPSVPIFGRSIQQDIDLGNQLVVPAGTPCFVSPYLVHRDATVFPDPEIFNPDRFLSENCIGRSPYSYIPFSAGFRNCIGQRFAILELKTLLSQLLRSFTFEALDEEKDLKIVPDVIIRPKDGLRFRISHNSIKTL